MHFLIIRNEGALMLKTIGRGETSMSDKTKLTKGDSFLFQAIHSLSKTQSIHLLTHSNQLLYPIELILELYAKFNLFYSMAMTI